MTYNQPPYKRCPGNTSGTDLIPVQGVKSIRVTVIEKDRAVFRVQFSSGLSIYVNLNEGRPYSEPSTSIQQQIESYRPSSHRDYEKAISNVIAVMKWMSMDGYIKMSDLSIENVKKSWCKAMFRNYIATSSMNRDDAVEIVKRFFRSLVPYNKMAYIEFPVPPVVASSLVKTVVPVALERTRADDMHVTVVYLGKTVSNEQFVEAAAVCGRVACKFGPIEMKAVMIHTFPENPDHRKGVPVIIRILSPALMDFQAELANSLDAAGVDFSKKFPDYKPHTTLGYAESRFEPFRMSENISWKAGIVAAWGGDDKYNGSFSMTRLSGSL